MLGDGKVYRDEFGPKIGEMPITEQQARNLGQGLDVGPVEPSVNTSSGQKTNTSSSGSGGGVIFAATLVLAALGIKSCMDDTPPPRTNTPAAAATTISPPLVKGAYYKVGHGRGVAFVDGGNELLKREFSTQACIVVTDPLPLMGTTLVKIDLPQPGLNNIPAYTDGRRLQYAPECTKPVTAPSPANANNLKGLTLLSKAAFLREEPGHSPIVTQILAGQCVLITDARRSEGWIKVKANTAKGTFEGWGYDIRMDYHKPCNP